MKSLSKQNKTELTETAEKFEVSAEGTNDEIRARIQAKIDSATKDEGNDNAEKKVKSVPVEPIQAQPTKIKKRVEDRKKAEEADIAKRKAECKKAGTTFGEAQ